MSGQGQEIWRQATLGILHDLLSDTSQRAEPAPRIDHVAADLLGIARGAVSLEIERRSVVWEHAAPPYVGNADAPATLALPLRHVVVVRMTAEEIVVATEAGWLSVSNDEPTPAMLEALQEVQTIGTECAIRVERISGSLRGDASNMHDRDGKHQSTVCLLPSSLVT